MNFPRKVFGIVLIIFTVIGLLFSIFGIVQVWRLRLPVANKAYESLVFSESVVNTSISGLEVVDSSLTNIRKSMDSLENSTQLIAQSMEDTSKMINSFSNLFKGDLKDTLENTNISLVAAQSSALIIDNLLYGLSKIPLLGIYYEPPKPLNEALKEIGDTIKDMPQSMDDISTNLTDSNDNLLSLRNGIDDISQSFENFQTDLSNAQDVITDYLTNLNEIQANLQRAQEKIFTWSIWAAVVFTILILLIIITQVAAILQGYEMMHYQRNLERLIERKIVEMEKLKAGSQQTT